MRRSVTQVLHPIWGILLGLTACQSPAPTGPATPMAERLVAVAGDGQQATVATEVPIQPAVRVVDADGNGVANIAVQFEITAGGGKVTPGTVHTDAAGLATADWIMGNVPGTNRLSIAVAGLDDSPIVLTATAMVGAANQIVVTAGAGQSATVGHSATVSPTIKVVDAKGNGVAGVAVAFSVVAGNGTLTGADAVTGALGTAQAGSWQFGTTVGPNTLRATAAGVPGSGIEITVIATADVPASLTAATVLDQAVLVGSTVPVAPRVRVRDQYGNAVSASPVTFQVVAGTGTLATPTVITNMDGEASASGWHAGDVPGDNRLQASVPGLPTVAFHARGIAFLQVAVGSTSVCGLVHGGQAYCWGSNSAGSLGNGDPARIDRPLPTAVAGGKAFTQLVGANGHFCALAPDGRAWCWGDNSRSQIGDGTPPFGNNDRLSPTAVSGSHQFVALVAGGLHTCGLRPDGSTWCWGGNGAGQLGNGMPDDAASTPVEVIGGHRFVKLAAGHEHTCGLTAQGSAYCWGAFGPGAVTFQYRLTPSLVEGNHTFTTIASGGGHNCATHANGSGWCWRANHDGQLGDGSQVFWQFLPVAVAGGHAFQMIVPSTGGPSYSCGIDNNGAAWCWGANPYGALGQGTLAPSPLPAAVQGNLRFTQLGTGFATTCAIAETTALYCWGLNQWGQLGDGSLLDRHTPTMVRFTGG